MFWLKNKKIKFSLCTLNLSPVYKYFYGLSIEVFVTKMHFPLKKNVHFKNNKVIFRMVMS